MFAQLASMAPAEKDEARCRSDTCSTWVDDELEARGIDLPDELRSGCCVKDEEQAARTARLVRVLRAADPTTAALRRHSAVLSSPAAASSGPEAVADEGDGAPSDESSDFGEEEEGTDRAVWDHLREDRLRQLRAAAGRARDDRRGGGEYTELRDVQALARLVKAHRVVVLHLPLHGACLRFCICMSTQSSHLTALRSSRPPSHVGVDACGRTDELLSSAAPRYLATRFARVPDAAVAAKAMGEVVVSPPALVVFRRGAVKAVASGLAPFGGAAAYDERAVTKWLTRARALRTGEPGQVEPGGSSSSEEGDDGDGEALGTPCPSCGRTYPHEHVRALRPRGLAVGSDEDDQ